MSLDKVKHLQTCSLNSQVMLDYFRALMPDVRVFKLTPLGKGLSNDNFLIESSIGPLLLKSYRDNFPILALNSQLQLAHCHEVTAKVHAWSEAMRIAVFEFLPGIDSPTTLTKELLQTVITVHQFEPSSLEANYLDIIPLLKPLEKSLVGNVKEALAWSIAQLEQHPKTQAFCHNDLVRENLIISKERTKIIDFEYCASNDIFFDLAALCCSFDMTMSQSSNMLALYYDLQQQPLPEYADIKLAAYRCGYLLLSIQWYEQRGYVELADPLLRQLDQCVAQIPPSR
ncbi:phosphotransferase [Pseudoalteromonas sp. S16_S37]|uniref:phosphotransferase n=1 Tax=Pseudoalteromonas sp. S16_S37 TaxID=2720228 RepID=UPI0016814272|nr:phosphotransferase [Pseudoalteromonas sp. S16_S37]MBD1580714.1 phosphotransferase [Pseudoalteromonas sp. S16_S37]